MCGKVIVPKKLQRTFILNFFSANLHGFENNCKLPVAHTIK